MSVNGCKAKLILCFFAILLSGCNQHSVSTFDTNDPQRFDNVIDIALYKKAVREQPNNPEYLLNLAEKYTQLLQWNHAAASFREALLVRPNEPQAMIGFSHALLALGKYEESLHYAREGFSNSNTEKALLISAVASDGLGQNQKATGIYQNLINNSPRNLAARNNLALSLAIQGRPESYEIMRQVAFSPDAQMRHKRNLVLVGAILGRDKIAAQDAIALDISNDISKQIIVVGKRVNRHGVSAVGIASVKDL